MLVKLVKNIYVGDQILYAGSIVWLEPSQVNLSVFLRRGAVQCLLDPIPLEGISTAWDIRSAIFENVGITSVQELFEQSDEDLAALTGLPVEKIARWKKGLIRYWRKGPSNK